MNSIRKLPACFSAVAFLVSVTVCIIKGISLTATLQRVAASLVLFYILGYCILVVLSTDVDDKDKEKEKEKDDSSLSQDTDGEFEEIEFPVIETEEKDVPVRG